MKRMIKAEKNCTKTLYKLLCVLFSFVFILNMGFKSVAADDSKLISSLKKNCIYYVTSIEGINADYEGLCVIVYGNISKMDDSKKEVIIKEGKRECKLDTSAKAVKSIVENLKGNERLMVYGKIKEKGKKDEIYTITVDKVEISTGAEYEIGSYIFPEKMVTEKKETIDKEGVSFLTYKEWDNEKVRDYLEDNENTKGYQYYLNVLSEKNYDSPELFYIFYFRKNNFLENDLWITENRRIELAIINNILCKETPLNWWANNNDIKNIKCGDESDVHYYTKLCRVAENKSVTLEFVFIPDDDGIVCTLYLHSPNIDEHAEQVAFVIESIRSLSKIE